MRFATCLLAAVIVIACCADVDAGRHCRHRRVRLRQRCCKPCVTQVAPATRSVRKVAPQLDTPPPAPGTIENTSHRRRLLRGPLLTRKR